MGFPNTCRWYSHIGFLVSFINGFYTIKVSLNNMIIIYAMFGNYLKLFWSTLEMEFITFMILANGKMPGLDGSCFAIGK